MTAAAKLLPRWLPVLIWAGVIFAFSSVASLSSGLGGWDLLLRKGAHVVEFAILGALLLRAARRPVVAVLLGVAYAVSDEIHQHFVPGRQGTPLDVLIDTAGVVAGVALYSRLCRRPM
ncbi:MAG: VanZ family protein [Gaiella sp.]